MRSVNRCKCGFYSVLFRHAPFLISHEHENSVKILIWFANVIRELMSSEDKGRREKAGRADLYQIWIRKLYGMNRNLMWEYDMIWYDVNESTDKKRKMYDINTKVAWKVWHENGKWEKV